MKKLFYIAAILIIAFTSCKDEPLGVVEPHEEYLFSQNGFFILNEGNYNGGNGTLSFYSFDSTKYYDAIFNGTNGRLLGDVVQFMTSFDTIGMVTVNNSQKIEFFSVNTLKSMGTMHGFTSPREILAINKEKAYVSDLYNDTLSVINPSTKQFINKIPLGRTSENLILKNNKLFVSHWSRWVNPNVMNDKVMVIDVNHDKIVDSIDVAIEPNSMVLDNDGFLWVLCSGGYTNDENPALIKINTSTNDVVTTFTFPDINSSPSNLTIDSDNHLYFINEDVFRMNASDTELPTEAFIQENQKYYELKVFKDKVILSDALNYKQRGIIFIYNKNGELESEFRAGLIPGYFYELPQ